MPGKHGERLIPARGQRLALSVQGAEAGRRRVQLRLRGRRLADLLAQVALRLCGLRGRPAKGFTEV